MFFSLHKDVLEKLKTLHPLPGLILEWRRINNAITKVVFPLQREKRLHSVLGMERIYPVSQTHTATGKEMCAKLSLIIYFWQCLCEVKIKEIKNLFLSKQMKIQKYLCHINLP